MAISSFSTAHLKKLAGIEHAIDGWQGEDSLSYLRIFDHGAFG
ncbi:hypothetical protein ACQ86N_15770 [Puia sp. P3]